MCGSHTRGTLATPREVCLLPSFSPLLRSHRPSPSPTRCPLVASCPPFFQTIAVGPALVAPANGPANRPLLPPAACAATAVAAAAMTGPYGQRGPMGGGSDIPVRAPGSCGRPLTPASSGPTGNDDEGGDPEAVLVTAAAAAAAADEAAINECGVNGMGMGGWTAGTAVA